MTFLSDPHFWVFAAFVLFAALVYKKAARYTTRALDDRAHKIRIELDHARRLREEAETILADYRQKQSQYLKEAETMLADARRDADTLGKHAEQEMKASLDARMQQAMEKIAQEESKAIQEVRNHIVDIALAAAHRLIAKQQDPASQDAWLKRSLSDIERKIH